MAVFLISTCLDFIEVPLEFIILTGHGCGLLALICYFLWTNGTSDLLKRVEAKNLSG